MKGSPCCAGLMRSCLHTYRTKTNLTQHIIQQWGEGASGKYGGHQPTMAGPSAKYGGVINQLWGGPSAKYGGGHQPTMGGHQPTMGGAISQVWGGHIFPPVCTGSQNPQNYFSNTYVLPSVNRTAGPITEMHNEGRKIETSGLLAIHKNLVDLFQETRHPSATRRTVSLHYTCKVSYHRVVEKSYLLNL